MRLQKTPASRYKYHPGETYSEVAVLLQTSNKSLPEGITTDRDVSLRGRLTTLRAQDLETMGLLPHSTTVNNEAMQSGSFRLNLHLKWWYDGVNYSKHTTTNMTEKNQNCFCGSVTEGV